MDFTAGVSVAALTFGSTAAFVKRQSSNMRDDVKKLDSNLRQDIKQLDKLKRRSKLLPMNKTPAKFSTSL
ncbi:TPA: hypothetical protein ACH3X3_013177 [Trebouxia sp. C0006]